MYTLEYNETVADILGRLNELTNITYGVDRINEENMDLWNNAVGRKYGEESKSKTELIKYLIKALSNEELIIEPNDKRRYDGSSSIKRKPKSLVIVIEESDSGENLIFYDINSKEVFSKDKFVSMIKSGSYPDYSVKIIEGRETPVSKRDRFNFNNLG